ncbi:hypothetical protein POM88_053800 [Heracleum sosnowskyi]|uniref:Uncharacterized protein n=1 Tax=Heracleum sosnowskyi TaxID=360622 RepID=A0AAD8GP57_9APIA|nr:hypothetical protein POM88_053800 [Heracleum sosnowskyi]
MRSLAQLKMMGRNLLCKRMKIYTANITYNSCLYASSRNYQNACTCSQFSEKREQQLLEEHKVARKGDKINLQNLLFTDYRDYVIGHNDVRVKSAELAGKVIVLYFLPLHHDLVYSKMSTSYLTDTYTYLLPDNVFEVVLVAYGTAEDLLLSDSYKDNQSNFESIFRQMPWTAIPFLDITSREHLNTIFRGNDGNKVRFPELVGKRIILYFEGYEWLKRDQTSMPSITDKLGVHSLRQHHWYIQSTCATSGEGLYEGLDWLSNNISNKVRRDADFIVLCRFPLKNSSNNH